MRGESGMLAAIDMTSELSGSLGLRLRLTLQGEQKYRGKPAGAADRMASVVIGTYGV